MRICGLLLSGHSLCMLTISDERVRPRDKSLCWKNVTSSKAHELLIRDHPSPCSCISTETSLFGNRVIESSNVGGVRRAGEPPDIQILTFARQPAVSNSQYPISKPGSYFKVSNLRGMICRLACRSPLRDRLTASLRDQASYVYAYL